MTNPDLDWALDLYGQFARGGDSEAMLYAVIDGAPWSKSRPRFGNGRTYQPTKDARAEAAMRTHLAAAGAPKFPGNVLLLCRFYRPNTQRIDTDNLIKHVCDSATGILWDDDSQVTLTIGEMLLDAERPRTVIVAGPHESTLLRGEDRAIDCEHCEQPFIPTNHQRFCSRACSTAARVTNLKDRICIQCAAAFHPATRTQKLCSEECRRVHMVARNQINGRPRSNCAECGVELSHRRGGRCRPCWRANPRMYTNTIRDTTAVRPADAGPLTLEIPA